MIRPAPRAAFVLCFAAASLLWSTPARADAWTEALGAELARRAKPAEVLSAYAAAIKAVPAHAADARWRRAQLYAELGQAAEAKAELEALRQEHPDAYARAATQALEDVPAFVAAAATGAGLQKRYAERRISLNLQQTPLAEALEFLQDAGGLNLLALPDVDPSVSVSLRLEGISFASAIKLVLASDADLESRWMGNVLVVGRDFAPIAPKKWTTQEIQANPDVAWKAISRRVTVNFDGTPLEEVLMFLGDITGLKLSLSAAAREANPDVTLKLKDVSLGDLLSFVCGAQGLRWSVSEQGIEVSAP